MLKKALELFSLLPRYRFTLNVNLIYTYHLIEQGENMHILSSYHFLLLDMIGMKKKVTYLSWLSKTPKNSRIKINTPSPVDTT